MHWTNTGLLWLLFAHPFLTESLSYQIYIVKCHRTVEVSITLISLRKDTNSVFQQTLIMFGDI